MGIITGIQWDVSGIYTYNYQKSWLLGKSSASRRIINHIMGVKGGPVNYHTIYPCGWMGWVVELLQGLNVPLFPNNHKCIHIYIHTYYIYIHTRTFICGSSCISFWGEVAVWMRWIGWMAVSPTFFFE